MHLLCAYCDSVDRSLIRCVRRDNGVRVHVYQMTRKWKYKLTTDVDSGFNECLIHSRLVIVCKHAFIPKWSSTSDVVATQRPW